MSRNSDSKKQRGSASIFFVLGITTFMGVSALAIDVGMMMTARSQMQAAVDASALAAASGLVVSQSEAMRRGIELSGQNLIANKPLNLASGEISFLGPRTVKVVAERSLELFFSRIFNRDSTQISASATAEMGNRDIMLLFDRSLSMAEDTVDPEVPQPLTDTKDAALYFINAVMGNTFVLDQIGLVSYSSSARMDLELGRDFNAMQDMLDSYIAGGATNIGDAIRQGRDHLESRARWRTSKVAILLSDGRANRPGWNPSNYALDKANSCAEKGIKIFTISLGNKTDIPLMEEIASITGGKHFHSPSTAELNVIFQEIADWVPLVLVD